MGPPFPGPYSFKNHPWCRELHDADAPFLVAKKCAQAGFTEVAINRALFTIDVHRRSVLYVLPTKVPDAADFSAARFGAALELSPYLSKLFTDINKIDLKQAAGASLYIRGANSESGLKSIPVSELILDEYDEMPEKSVRLALHRLDGQLHKHVFMLSTPTIPNYGIDAQYRLSTQEHFFFRCPSCSKFIEFIWPDSFVVCGASPTDDDTAKSHLICYECKAVLPHEGKAEYLSSGHWEATTTNSRDIRGFEINQLYSPTRTPAEIARDWLLAQSSEIAMQEFMNSVVGKAYLASDAQVRESHIEESILRGGHSINDARPKNQYQIITMGVDQGKWNYVVVLEWFYSALTYDLNANSRCRLLWAGKFPETDFGQLDRLMREWQVRHCVIDADPNINDARRFARRYNGYVTLCRYRGQNNGKEITITDQDSGAPIATVDRTNWIDCALSRYHNGTIALPRDISNEFKEHIKAPARRYVKTPDGNVVARYVETGPDHYAHAQTYAEIALPLAASQVSSRSIGAFL